MPGAFWLAYVESRSPQPTSWQRLGLTFGAGALSVGGVSLFHTWVEVSEPIHPAGLLVYLCTIVGLLEESCKFLAVMLVAWPRRDFREAWDGLACASAAALGFASAENFTYVLSSGNPQILLGRSVSATFAHVAMSGMWGYALGLYRQGQARVSVVLEALFWSAVFHGFYDWFLSVSFVPGALLVFGGLILVFRQRLQESYFTSVRRQAPSQIVRECRGCRTLARREYAFCPQCGDSAWMDPCRCLSCLAECPEASAQCPACQRPLV
jgi:RsiW-degrading membrane proteinase PrsW (M82 family)